METSFPTKRFSAFALGIFSGFVIASSAFLVTSVAAGPTASQVAQEALSLSYNSADSIQGHCTAIIESVEAIKASSHNAAQGLK